MFAKTALTTLNYIKILSIIGKMPPPRKKRKFSLSRRTSASNIAAQQRALENEEESSRRLGEQRVRNIANYNARVENETEGDHPERLGQLRQRRRRRDMPFLNTPSAKRACNSANVMNGNQRVIYNSIGIRNKTLMIYDLQLREEKASQLMQLKMLYFVNYYNYDH